MAGRFSTEDWKALHGIVFFALLTAATFVPIFRTWPLIWVVPLAGYFAAVWLLRPLRSTFTGWKFGHVYPSALLATGGIAIVSSAALLLFQKWWQPDLHAYAAALPRLPHGGLFIAGIAFAVLNAFLEELIFRGVLFTAIVSQVNTPTTVLITALLFGWGHMHGYPPGPLGAVLAGFYGLALGWLRVFTGGLGLPVMAHIVADATIFIIVVQAGLL
jgi:membrane protease YdiL (CAAX protease family)